MIFTVSEIFKLRPRSVPYVGRPAIFRGVPKPNKVSTYIIVLYDTGGRLKYGCLQGGSSRSTNENISVEILFRFQTWSSLFPFDFRSSGWREFEFSSFNRIQKNNSPTYETFWIADFPETVILKIVMCHTEVGDQ